MAGKYRIYFKCLRNLDGKSCQYNTEMNLAENLIKNSELNSNETNKLH